RAVARDLLSAAGRPSWAAARRVRPRDLVAVPPPPGRPRRRRAPAVYGGRGRGRAGAGPGAHAARVRPGSLRAAHAHPLVRGAGRRAALRPRRVHPARSARPRGAGGTGRRAGEQGLAGTVGAPVEAPVKRWDAVVVGAGPAGSFVARELARAGT